MRNIGKILLLALLFLSVIVACNNKQATDKKNSENHSITYTLIELDKGWGYKIFMDGNILIEQRIVPSVEGYNTFNTINDAETIAIFVVQKLEMNVYPPTVTKIEMDSLNVSYSVH